MRANNSLEYGALFFLLFLGSIFLSGHASFIPSYAISISSAQLIEENRNSKSSEAQDNGRGNSMNPTVIAAVVAAVASVVAAILTGTFGSLNQRRLVSLQGESERRLALLQEQIDMRKRKEDARTNYELEARKRLYEQCEPILFQLYELSESATNRLFDLAEQIKDGRFQSQSSSPADDSYTIQSTIFRLLSPLSAFKLLQQKLTFVDLRLDTRINIQYNLIKRIYFTFAADSNLAGREPSLPYYPYNVVSNNEQKKFPEIYNVQGIKAGMVDNLAKTLVKEKPGEPSTLMDFGEFRKVYGENRNEIFTDVRNLFQNFHPKRSPILWRILIVQTHIYEALLKTYASASDGNFAVLHMITIENRYRFDWRQEEEKETIPDSVVLDQPFNAVEGYLREYLGAYFVKG